MKASKISTGNRDRSRDLHNDEINEVDRRSYVELLGIVIRVDVIRENAIGEPQRAEGDSVTLEIPISHGERSHGFDHTKDPIRLDDELPIDQPVFFEVTRLP